MAVTSFMDDPQIFFWNVFPFIPRYLLVLMFLSCAFFSRKHKQNGADPEKIVGGISILIIVWVWSKKIGKLILYTSGSRPGVREKSQGVRQIIISLR